MASEEPRSVDRRLTDPLSEITRKERRNLLAASFIAGFVGYADLVPSEINGLGITFSAIDQSLLLKAGAVVVAYFLLAFGFYGLVGRDSLVDRFSSSAA